MLRCQQQIPSSLHGRNGKRWTIAPTCDSWKLGGQERPAVHGPAVRDRHRRYVGRQLRPLQVGFSRSSPTGPPHLAGNVPTLAPELLALSNCQIKSNSWAVASGPHRQCRPSGRLDVGSLPAMRVPGPVKSSEIADGRKVDAPVDTATLNFAEGYAYWPHVDKSSVLC